MPHRILEEDWSDYDNRKKRFEDRLFFSCEEKWERDYLVQKIQNHEKNKTETAIREAIEKCCKEITAPRPREKFVKCVMGKL